MQKARNEASRQDNFAHSLTLIGTIVTVRAAQITNRRVGAKPKPAHTEHGDRLGSVDATSRFGVGGCGVARRVESVMDLSPLDSPIDTQAVAALGQNLTDGLGSQTSIAAGAAGFIGFVVHQVNGAAQWLSDQPTAPWIAAIVTVLAGVVLWLAGARVLKPALALLGLLCGGASGALLFPMFSAPGAPTPGNIDPAWIGLACGGILGLLATLLAYRTAIAVSLGVVCATLAFVATAGVLGVAQLHAPDRTAEADTSPKIWIVSHGDSPASGTHGGFVRPIQNTVHADEPVSTIGLTGPAASLEFAVRERLDIATDHWRTLSRGTQMTLLLSTLGGLLAGMILGLAATRSATALLTASVGSAAWMLGVAWLATQLTPGLIERAGVQPVGWITIWLTLAAGGMFLQRQRRGNAPTAVPVQVHVAPQRPL